MAIQYGRCIVGPKGEVRYDNGCQEHADLAEEVVRERGGAEQQYDASRKLDDEGWVRVTNSAFTTLAYFRKVQRLTQAQRDIIFDMAMAQMEAGLEYAARELVACLEAVQD